MSQAFSITGFLAFVLAGVCLTSHTATGQSLDLGPKSSAPSTFESTATLASQMETAEGEAGSKSLSLLGSRLLGPTSSPSERNERTVLALTLAKAAQDPVFLELPTEKREEFGRFVDALSADSVDVVRRQLREIVVQFEALPLGTPWTWDAHGSARTAAAPPASLTPWIQKRVDANLSAPEILEASLWLDELARGTTTSTRSQQLATDLSVLATTVQQWPRGLSPQATEAFALALTQAVLEAQSQPLHVTDRLSMFADLASLPGKFAVLPSLPRTKVDAALNTLFQKSQELRPESARPRLETISRILEEASARIPTPEAARVARQLRPVFLKFASEAAAAQRSLGPLCVSLLDTNTSLTDPALSGARRRFDTASDRLAAVIRISRASEDRSKPLNRGQIATRPELAPGLERILHESKGIGRRGNIEAKLLEVSELCVMVDAATALHRFPDIQNAEDQTTIDFVTRYKGVSEAWIKSLADRSKPKNRTIGAELLVAVRVLEFVDDAQCSPEAMAALMAWPGFETSVEGREALFFGLEEQSNGAMRAWTNQQLERADVLVNAGRTRFAAALAVNSAAKTLVAAQVEPPTVWSEISAEAPDAFRMVAGQHVPAFAEICTLAEEIAHRRGEGQPTGELEKELGRVGVGIGRERPRQPVWSIP